MAVQPSDDLTTKIRDYTRFRNTAIGQTGMALEPTFTAGAYGGPGAAAATARGFYPQGTQGFTPEEAIGVKAKLIKDIGQTQKDLTSGKIGLAEALAKQDDAFKELSNFVAKVHGDTAGANATTAASRNAAIASVGNKRAEVVMKAVELASPQNAENIRRTLDDIMGGMNSPDQIDPATTQKFLNAMNMMIASGDRSGAAALAATMDAVAPQKGLASWRQFLQEAAANGDQSAAQANNLINGLSDVYGEVQRQMLLVNQAEVVASLDALSGGVASTDPAVKTLKAMMAEFDIDPSSPEKTAASIERAFKAGMPGEGGDALENYKRLLDQIDSETLDPTSNLAEARRRLFADPEFQKWKKENGIQNDMMALKELRRLTQMKIHSQRQADRRVLAERHASGTGPLSGPPSSAAGLVGKPQGGSAAPSHAPLEAGAPTFVRSPEGKIWAYDATGLHPLSGQERMQFLKLAQEAPTPQDADALVQPPSEFVKYQSMGNQQRSAGIMSEAREKASEPEGVVPAQTLGTMAGDVTYAAAHPMQTAGKLRTILTEKMRKKKKDEEIANQAGVLGGVE